MTPDSSSEPPIFELFSIAFGGPGGSALAMRDLLTEVVHRRHAGVGRESPLGADRLRAGRHRHAATSSSRRATSMSVPSGSTSYTIQATGDLFNVDAASGASIDPAAERLLGAGRASTLSSAMPAGIGIRTFTLDWTATDASGKQFAHRQQQSRRST